MAPSSIPTAKTALLALIETRPNLATVQTEWAWPGADVIQKEAIWMGDAGPAGDEETFIGNVSHREHYRIPVAVSVLGESDDAKTTELRMWALVAEVEAALRATSSLADAAGILSAVVKGKQPHNFISDQGWVSECVILVECQSRI